MNPKVSVVIPTYNRAATVRKRIESVLAQTVTDLEVIVVDDGSSDDTGKILRETFGDRIRYYAQPNQGASVARNRGSRKRGESGSLFWTPTISGKRTNSSGSSRPWSDLAPSAAGATRTFDSSTTRKHGPSSKWRKTAIGMKERWASTRTCYGCW